MSFNLEIYNQLLIVYVQLVIKLVNNLKYNAKRNQQVKISFMHQNDCIKYVHAIKNVQFCIKPVTNQWI